MGPIGTSVRGCAGKSLRKWDPCGMRDRRRLRAVGAEPPYGDPGMTVRECREPVIRSAQEGRQLLERMGAGGSGTPRLPRNRALEARSLLLQRHETSSED